VRALLKWYERVGFDGAPRFLGFDDQGREVLSFVEGEPAFAPVPYSDDIVVAIGRLLRRAHDAQEGFAPPVSDWDDHVPGPGVGEVIGHCDLFWTNVIFREGLPFALIDWELAAPATRVLDVGLAATYWGGVRVDWQLREWGLPLDRRRERLRLLCDGYGFDAAERARLLDELVAQRRGRLERGDWRVASRSVIDENLLWLEEHQEGLARFLA
jgi:aminoglycoside phosphotransferase (APT) family kinase protein